MYPNTILISLGISSAITAISTGLEYLLLRRGTHETGGVVEVDPPFYYSLPSRDQRRCDYCNTIQNIGAHCLNCGAAL